MLAHGFTQNSLAWGRVAELLSARHQVVAVDLPGHGASAAVRADLTAAGGLLAATGGVADYLGYSLGGRVCLHTALDHGDVVRRLVLIGATPGIVDVGERARRRRHDDDLADRLDPPGGPAAAAVGHDERARLDDFLSQWLAEPLFASLPPEAAALDARRRNTCAGLASSLRDCGTGTQEPLWGRLGELRMPVLVVVGELDRRFVDIGRKMVAGIGSRARLHVVPGAGHACHLERPEDVADIVGAFLES